MKKDDIINAALDEFGRYDYERASINTIIKNSDTSKGTFYHYFENKEALYLALIKIVGEEKVRFLQQNSKGSLEPGYTIFEMLKHQIETSMAFAVAYPTYAQFSSKVANETGHEIKQKVQSIIGSNANEFFSTLIGKNIRQHKIRSDIPEEFICQLFTYMITQFNDFIIKAGVKMKPENMDQIMQYLRYYIDFLENGLRGEE